MAVDPGDFTISQEEMDGALAIFDEIVSGHMRPPLREAADEGMGLTHPSPTLAILQAALRAAPTPSFPEVAAGIRKQAAELLALAAAMEASAAD